MRLTCRVCLRTASEFIDMESPYGHGDNAQRDLTYLDCFRAVTQLDIAISENVPQCLCFACCNELKAAYSFLLKALNAERTMQRRELNVLAIEYDATYMDDETLDEVHDVHDQEQPAVVVERAADGMGVEGQKAVKTPGRRTDKMKDEARLVIADVDVEEDVEVVVGAAAEAKKPEHDDNEESKFYEIDVVDDGDDCQVQAAYEVDENADNHSNCTVTDALVSANNDDNDDDNDIEQYIYGDDELMSDAIGSTQQEATPVAADAVVAPMTENDEEGLLDEGEYLSSDDEESVIVCTKCNVAMPSSGFAEHAALANCTSIVIYQCLKCDVTFESREELVKHTCGIGAVTDLGVGTGSTVSSTVTDGVLRCNMCGKTFRNAATLNTHLKYHLRKEANHKGQTCNICDKTFSSQYYCQIHQQHVHGNIRELYQCEHCAKMYFSKTALDSHMRIHTGDTKECMVCGKQFVRQYELNVHMRFHTGDYPFSCKECGRRFAIKGHLRSHMWKHQGLKLQCDDCGKLFTSTKALQEHSFTHTEMPFCCSYCNKGYPSKQKYKVHLRKAHFIELDAQELEKVMDCTPKPLQRKKRTLVQADSAMKEVEVKTK